MPVMNEEIRVQAGSQSAFETGVTPTISLRGFTDFNISSVPNAAVLDDMTAGLGGGDTSVLRALSGKGSFEGWGTYDHLPYLYDNLFGEATPSGAGPFIRAWSAPGATAPDTRILSFTKGDSVVGAFQLIGGLVTQLTQTVTPATELTFRGDLIGHSVDADALENLTPPVVYPIMGHQLATIKWDAWGGTMGTTTLAACTVRQAELNISPTRETRPCFGQLEPGSYVEKPWEASLRLLLEFNSTSKAIIESIISALSRYQVQLNWADTSARALKWEFAGTVTDELQIFDDDDGVVAVNVTLSRTRHPTFGNWFKASITNGLATLP